MKKREFFWSKVYTREELMKESRIILGILFLIHVAIGWLTIKGSITDDGFYDGLGTILVASVYLLAAILKSFWFRFICIAIWLCDMLYTNIAIRAPSAGSVIFILIGLVFIYKMFKYRSMATPKVEADVA